MITLVIHDLVSSPPLLPFLPRVRSIVDELSLTLAKSFICHHDNHGEVSAKRVT